MALETVLVHVAVGRPDEDQAESFASTVTDIAGPAGASVVLLHVFDEQEYDDAVDSLDFEAPADADVDEVTSRLTAVRSVANALRDNGIGVEVRGEVGDEGESIVESAATVDADLIIVAGRKRSPTGKAVFGSTSQEVMLNAHCPVTFVRLD